MTRLILFRNGALITILLLTAGVFADPCTNHSLIENEEKRSSAYTYNFDTDFAFSDDALEEGWYKVISKSGTEIPTEAPDTFKCGTWYPIWLDGLLPSVLDGVVTRKVCTRTFTDLCEEFWNIDMKNCTDFYVYQLKPSLRAKAAYCFGTGGFKCPDGQSSLNGFHPGCTSTGFPTEEVVPRVISSLDIGSFDQKNPQYGPSLVVVFQCIFDEVLSYVYDVSWYINDHYVKEYQNKLYNEIRKTDLRPEDWVGRHRMNMIVKCSVRLRNATGTIPGFYHDSDWFKAGVYPENFQYQVIESENTLISYNVTVPVGCFSAYNQNQCHHLLYITQPNYQQTPATCSSSNILQQDIAFNGFEFCGLSIPSSTHGQKIQFNVTGYIDGQYNGDRKRTTQISVTSRPSTADRSGAWDNISIPIIKILVSDADEKMKGRHCQVYNDPHFYTADRKYYNYYGTGEHILYQNTKYPYQVNAVFTKCWRASCNCGIAIRSGKSLLVVRTCATVSRTKFVRGLSTPYIAKRVCDDSSISIDNSQDSGKKFVVTLPIGTEITFRVNGRYIDYIYIKPSVLDLGSTEGLCGYVSSENKNTDDDFLSRGETIAITNSQQFAKSWMITDTRESLFVENPTIIEESNDLPSFCQCASEGATEADITNKYRLHCNLTQPMEPCYDVETNLSFKSKCTDGTRKKRSINEIGINERGKKSITDTDDTDDVIEFPPFEILSDVYDESFVAETPRWHNGWNEEQAEATSREYFDRNFPIDVRVASGISIEDYINSSIEDIKITGDTAFLATTLSVMQTAAKAELVRNQSLSEQITDDGTTLLEKLSSHLCLNNCISNGQCKNGSCICNELFGGEDCAKPKSTPPSNVSLPDSGLCDVRKRACKKTYVYGYFIPPDIYCKTKHFEFFENTRSYKETTTAKATMINSYMVSCDLPHARQKRSTTSEIIFAEGYEISVSNDGSNFGEDVTILVYDEECFSCETVNVTCTALDTCPSTTAITGTNEQSASEKGREDEDEINVALPIGVVAGLLILGVLIAVMIYKFKHENIGNSQINIIGQEESDQTPTPCLDKEHSKSSMFSIRIQE
ncbi:von Willebrand factor D and EGF domain-containing protein-like [Mytilus galloprovincialis]|uniref:von Willebrand factor D and EGF domain-containing protein-like n=1 Tax=Mytilus galloprovincialis TaxID=29158 RepID=UPI003F7BD931